MKIAIAGGLGFEEELVSTLKGHKILMIGSGFDIETEKFIYPSGIEFIGEYISHNYSSMFQEYDIFIDFSENLKSKFILNDFAVKYSKRYISVFYQSGWKIFSSNPLKGCFQCFSGYEKPLPFFLLPQIKKEKVLIFILQSIELKNEESLVYDLESDERLIIDKKSDCPSCNGKYHFMNGEMADVAAVSCGDNYVSITPMDDVNIDLSEYREYYSGNKCQPKEVRIVKENPFFLEFKTAHLNAVLFRQGRLVVKGTKDKNSALYIYRRYV